MSSRGEKAAAAQAMFREVNERIAELTGTLGGPAMTLFICECSDEACAESLEVTPSKYRALRDEGDRFIVCAGHELPEGERVVGGNRRFLVVEKEPAIEDAQRRGLPSAAERRAPASGALALEST